ncbi:MAG TPA: DUF2203 domain-containing protein [Chloroflexota bacterium]|nr:DUF2203 domain-containing protein [Chloroflexota bacterium]
MRLFTIAEANALIPRLEEIFAQVRQRRDQARPAQQALAQVEQTKRSNGADHSHEIHELRAQLDAAIDAMNALLQAISALGIEVKDVDQGLVDFPHQREGRVVYLCWKSGEDRVRFWHELSTGFAGRQPLTSEE